MRRVAIAFLSFAALTGGLAQAAADKAQSPWSWTGFYIGGNAGYGWDRADTVTTVPDSFAFPNSADNAIYSQAASPSFKAKGFSGGGQVGFNYQLSAFVFGLEADYNTFRLRGSADTMAASTGIPVINSHTELNTNWLFTLRPRAGIAFDRFLVYGTAGLAMTNIKYSQDNAFTPTCPNAGFPCTESAAASKTKSAWVVGGGVEAALIGNLTVKAEYLYVNFGSIGGTTGFDSIYSQAVAHDASLKASIARIGVNYRFGLP